MLNKFMIIAIIILSAIASPSYALPNLLTDGSFEAGGLAGWTTSGTYIGYPVAVIRTDGIHGDAFGEAVPADTVIGGSPDAAGTHGVYFVDDKADQWLTQSIFLNASHYEIGFDAYLPYNGMRNPGDATFSGTIAGVTLANFSVHNQGTSRTWLHFSGIADVSSAGLYDVAFNFQTFGGASADVVVDRVYIVGSNNTGGTKIPPPSSVPEPSAFLLVGTGLTWFGLLRKRFES